ncbi:hypothetical protein BEE12_22570 (plasmid) [Pantoea agglomerans]|nr:hypothetical protein BEE12_22120 [Pantoea agglomerans]AOE42583.1 hypothetical protein BEE12_22570 [Pantoea agglomerans]
MSSNGRSGSDFSDLPGGTRRVRGSCIFQQTKGLRIYPQAFLFMLHPEVNYTSEKRTGIPV